MNFLYCFSPAAPGSGSHSQHTGAGKPTGVRKTAPGCSRQCHARGWKAPVGTGLLLPGLCSAEGSPAAWRGADSLGLVGKPCAQQGMFLPQSLQEIVHEITPLLGAAGLNAS